MHYFLLRLVAKRHFRKIWQSEKKRKILEEEGERKNLCIVSNARCRNGHRVILLIFGKSMKENL